MSHQFDPPSDEDGDPSPKEPPRGSVQTLGPGPVVIAAAVGLVAGWSIRLVSSVMDRPAPWVGWTHALVLFFTAAVLAGTAHLTRKAISEPVLRPEAHQLVNRLVLAKACAVAGGLVTGGYAGHALSWWGAASELAGQRALHAILAAIAGASVTIAALWLERACRVSPEADEE